MEQLAQWSPLITGAAWKGLVTEHAVLHLQIADGHAKEVAIDLINRGLDFDATETAGSGGRGRIEVLVGHWRDWPVMIAMHPIHELRGAARDDGHRGAERGHREQLIERRRRQWRPERPQGQARPAFLIGIVILVVSLLALAAGLGASWWNRQAVPTVEPAVQTLWNQQWPGPDGQPKSLETLRGQITVVNFWATWCAPCVEEMPALSALHQQMNLQPNPQNQQATGSPRPRIEFVGVAIDRADQVAEFARRTPVSYTLVVAGAAGSELGRAMGNEAGALPFTAVIDPSGRVVERTLGIVDIEKLRPLLERMQEGKR
jgi:thiol-disulfide isomerase/thioredoxin